MQWKDVKGYEGIYEVSDAGQIRSCKNKQTYTERHGKRKWEQRILSQRFDKEGSARVNLWKDGKEKTWLVHRIVALSFLEKSEGKDYVNHKDGNRRNNKLENLEWCDHKENNNHAFDNGLIKTCHRVILFDEGTNEKHSFRSKAKASEFLGKNPGFISGLEKKGKDQYQNYKILISKNGEQNETA